MKLCIVTVYNSENCGSYLQAYALGKILSDMGHEVTYLWRRKPKQMKDHLVLSLKKIIKLQFWSAYAEWEKCAVYTRLDKQFKTVKINELDDIDCFVIGSDTVWNFESDYFLKNKDIYSGRAFEGKRRVSYAASVGNTPEEMIKGDLEIVQGLKGFEMISVRDSYTKKIVDDICKKNSTLVLDPTLLFSRENYSELEADISVNKYLLIYMFGKINKEIQKEIIRIARRENLAIVSFGEYNSWADHNVVYDPKSFLAYFHHAEVVVTNTFHGTVFSVIYNKRFVDLGITSNKIVEFLRDIDLQNHLCASINEISKVAVLEPRYDIVNKKLESMRTDSLEFLHMVTEENDEI